MNAHNNEWPDYLWLVRHGESAGNVARDKAHAAGLERIDISERDVDVPLSARGEDQATALGDWFANMDLQLQPNIILTSPYRRAVATSETIQERINREAPVEIVIDERLREKEFGILDRLTRQGIQKFYPEQAEMRKHLGKFYHRPPGGESWCDVILRLRSVLHTISLHYAGRRVLIIGHQVLVLCFRYLLENLTEAQLLAIDSKGDVANCSVTDYRCAARDDSATLELQRYNWVLPLRDAGAQITSKPDPSSAAR
jgi:broad specificity phosphatase PhoE